MVLRNLSLTASSITANAWNSYKRLTTPRKLLLWIAVIFVTSILLKPQFGHPPPDIHRPPPFRPPWHKPLSAADKKTWRERSEVVKEAFQHAYGAYERSAFGHDELKPLSNTTFDNLNGWGLTIVDSLDTMLLMGLDEEFERGMEYVRTLDFKGKYLTIGFFETIIRYVGGFLAAYHMTSVSPNGHYRDQYPSTLLIKVNELSEILQKAFNTTSGLPNKSVQVNKDGTLELHGFRGETNLAEMASCQMEFKYLAYLTGKEEYFRNSDRVIDIMEIEQGKTMTPTMVPDANGNLVEKLMNDQDTGLWTNRFYLEDGKMFGNTISAGALGDSGYEYLLKGYLLSGRTEERLLRMYLKAMDGVINHLLYLSKDRNLLFVTELGNWGTPSGNMEHLACFLPGLLALGARVLDPEYPWLDRHSSRIYPRAPVPPSDLRATLDLHMRAATGLAHTCWVMYDEMPTGIGPEVMHFNSPPLEDGKLTRHSWESLRWGPKVKAWERGGRVGPLIGTEGWPKGPADKGEWKVRDSRYILRPEALEAMYLMWKTTGDPVWRERGWKMFEAINNYTRVENGYVHLSYIDTKTPRQQDGMSSFFLAETLKYAYLNTLDDDPIQLDQMVFNTEAHPLPMFRWTQDQISKWHIH